MWSDWPVVCDCGFSLSALWCPFSVPTVLLGLLLPWTWGISSQLLQQSTAAAPYLGRGVCPLCRCSYAAQLPLHLFIALSVKVSFYDLKVRKNLGEGNGNPLQWSCLENPMDRGAWWATVHGVTKSRTQLSDFMFTSLSYHGYFFHIY